MRSISPELIKRIRRADPGARTVIEGIEVVNSDILDTNDDWLNRRTSGTGISAVSSGGLKLTGSDTTLIESVTNDTNYITDLDLTDPVIALEIEWSGESAAVEIHNIDVRLVAQRVGGNPKTVDTWRGQLFRAVQRTEKADIQYTLAPISAPVDVSATGGTSPAVVTFPVTISEFVEDPVVVGDSPKDTDSDPNDRDSRPRTIFIIWALRDDGSAADNIGWEVDSTVNSVTNADATARRAELGLNQGQRIQERGLTNVLLLSYQDDLMYFDIRGLDYASAQTVTFSAAGDEIDLGAAPNSANRLEIVAEGQTRGDSSLTFEIDDGVQGWTTCFDGDRIGEDNTSRGGADLSSFLKQQTYDVRVTLTPSTDARTTPVVRRFGVQEMVVEDLDGIATIDNEVSWQISPETYRGEISEAAISVLKDGQIDYTDWATELLATRFINDFFFRIYIGSTNLDRQHWLHIDDFYVEDYLPRGAAIDFQCISALSKLKQVLPVYDDDADEREVLEYGAQSLKTVSQDIIRGQAELAPRLIGPGIEDTTTTVAKVIENSDAKAELDALAELAGGGWTTSQGRVTYKDISTQRPPVHEFDAEEIAWGRVSPGFTQRLPEFFVPFSWLPNENRFDSEVRRFHGPSLTNLGVATISTNRTLDTRVAKWIDTQSLAETIADRRVTLQGTGLMLWEFETIMPHPELEIGDVIRIPTDRFVGRDPSTSREIRGNAWVHAAIVGVRGHWGRAFQIWVRGFDDIVATNVDVTRKGFGINRVDFAYERAQSQGVQSLKQQWIREVSWINQPGVESVQVTVPEYLIQPTLDSGQSMPTTIAEESYHIDVTPNSTTVEFLRNVTRDSGNFTAIDGYIDLDDTNNGVAQNFTGNPDLELVSITVELRRVGSPVGEIVAKIYDDNTALPDTVVATSYPVQALLVSEGVNDEVEFSFPAGTNLAAATHHVAVEYTDGTATDYIRVGIDVGGGVTSGTSKILNGTWVENGPADMPHNRKFFESSPEYQLYAIEFDEENIIFPGSTQVTIEPFNRKGGAANRQGAGTQTQFVTKELLDYDDIGIRADVDVDRRIDFSGETFGSPGAGPNDLNMDNAANGFAFDYTPSAGHTFGQVAVYLKKTGSPTGNIVAKVYSSSGGLPNAVLATSDTIDVTTLPTSYDLNGPAVNGGFVFSTPATLLASTLYHISVEYTGGDATNYVSVAAESSGTNDELNGSWAAGAANRQITWRVYARETVERVARSLTPKDNLSAVYNQAAGLLELNASVTGGVSALDDLSDVTITAPAVGEYLRYSGSEWVDSAIQLSDLPAISLDDLSDVVITGASVGEFLRFNGSNWVDTTLVAGDIPSLDAAKITTGTFATARIPDLDAAKITSGTFANDRIAESNVTQHVGAIDHDSLLNYVAGQHVLHSSVSITGSSGLTGGGDLTASSSITVKYTSGSNLIDSAADSGDVVAADYILYQDLDTGDVRKDTVGALPFTNNAGDITRVNITAGNGLSGTSVDTTSGDHTQTLTVGAGDGITVSATAVGLDIDGLTDVSTETSPDDKMLGTDQLVFSRSSALFKDTANTIPLSAFNDDLGYTNVTASLGVKRVGNDIQVEYLAGGNSLYGASPSGTGVGTLETTDRILFADDSDSFNVKHAELSQLPFTNNAGTVTEVTVGAGLDVTNGTTTPNITVDLDELSAGGTLVATDSLVAVNGIATEKQLISAIPLGIFSNDQGWTSNAGTVTQVDGTGTVSGLTLTGSVTSSGSLTLGGTLSVLEGDIVDGSILARVASDETISGAYTFTDQDGIFVNVGAGGLYLQNSAFHAASLMTAGLKYVPGGGADNSPYDRLNWEYTDAAGASNNAGSAVIMRGNGSETGLTFEWYTAPTSTGAGANPASLTKRLDITTAAFEYGTSAQFRVTSAGLITAGEWDATTIAVDHGGTGLSAGIAANQFLMGNGTTNPYVASGANLVWDGSQLTINDATIAHTGTGGFTGDGSGLTGVNADNFDVTNLTTEVRTYYPMFADGTGSGVSGFVNSTDLRWKNTATANQLLLANGAEATPIIGFINDEDTGVYLASTGNLSLATGGSRIANFGTGMTLYGTLNIEQNAVSRFAKMTRTDLTDLTWDVRIDAAGDLEIRSTTDAGVTTLNALQMVHATGDLTLKGWVRSEDGAVGAPTWGFSSDTDTGMWLNGTGVLAFAVRGVNRFQIDESGTTTARTQFDATQVYNTEGTEITRGTPGSVTLDWDAYNQVPLRNDGNIDTINIDDNSMQDGGHYCLIVRAATGVQASITFSASGTLYWQGSTAPTFPLTAGNRTVITFIKTDGITIGYYADATA